MVVTADTAYVVGGTLRPFVRHEFEGMLLSGLRRQDSMEQIYSDELGDPVE